MVRLTAFSSPAICLFTRLQLRNMCPIVYYYTMSLAAPNSGPRRDSQGLSGPHAELTFRRPEITPCKAKCCCPNRASTEPTVQNPCSKVNGNGEVERSLVNAPWSARPRHGRTRKVGRMFPTVWYLAPSTTSAGRRRMIRPMGQRDGYRQGGGPGGIVYCHSDMLVHSV